MSDGPGLTCLYKDGEVEHFEASGVEGKMSEGWKDNPTDGAKAKRVRRTAEQIAADKAAEEEGNAPEDTVEAPEEAE